jgi:DNA-binding transcriptional LysR family regulator
VQDAAYDSLLRSTRQELHGRIARALETLSPELIDSQPEFFARHYAGAGLIEKSVSYWGKAGHRSVARAAIVEAAAAVDGCGVTRPLSYQVAEHVREGRLLIVLRSYEYTPLPVHIVTPEGRLSVPKVRAFVDFAVPCLRTQFARLTADAGA